MTQAALPIPPRWGPLNPQDWPQLDNRVPEAMAWGMPTVATLNRERSRQEAFTYSGTFTLPTTLAVGQTFPLIIATDQDGDFWCDQIFACSWGADLNAAAPRLAGPPLVGTLDISDARTGRMLTFPAGTFPTAMLSNVTVFSDDPGFDPGAHPYPAGWRTTSTTVQPFCFTRAGGIVLSLVSGAAWAGVAGPNLVDVCFAGWKEYAHAS